MTDTQNALSLLEWWSLPNQGSEGRGSGSEKPERFLHQALREAVFHFSLFLGTGECLATSRGAFYLPFFALDLLKNLAAWPVAAGGGTEHFHVETQQPWAALGCGWLGQLARKCSSHGVGPRVLGISSYSFVSVKKNDKSNTCS